MSARRDRPDDVRPTVVPDASAVLMLLIEPGTRGETAAGRLSGSNLAVPSLLPYEVANVLRRRRRAGLLSDTEARLAFDAASSLPVETWPFDAVAERVWALGTNLSAYDASYVALAELLDAVLVTADRRIAAAPGLRCRVDVVA
ncbi:type II toxin-antitoxin system VapC family toxin [Georgenia sp. TF02-10]|uniref:type II toxin-antitoxin system VapC family toxin n=1 Tax=Georgenia sp. TF02-10 TaxID=2917725 RepID=UPI001FA73592|nr:type II toxin-antitoxin system VapC family toxin [Georgenia sp. TF02-10]UNX54565.1 type II toxin-antitoxin system VapC family toxin [Georgenia sp. TF02-10]